MTWIKLANTMPAHPKVVMAGDRAGWLFVCGLCYSNEHLTDGFIAAHVLPVAAPGVKNPERLAANLVVAGLWHAVDGGWTINDYGDYQRSSGQIRDHRVKDAARKAAARSNGSPRGQITDSARNPGGVQPDPRAGDRGRSQEESRGEVEKRNNVNAELRSAVIECFAYWQHRCGHPQAQLSDDRRGKLETRLRERRRLHGNLPDAIADVRLAIDGAATAPFIDESGKRFDDIELICRKGSKLEDFMGRAAAPAGGNVVPMRDPALVKRDRFMTSAEYQEDAS